MINSKSFNKIYTDLKFLESEILAMLEFHGRTTLQFFANFNKIGRLKTLLVQIRIMKEIVESIINNQFVNNQFGKKINHENSN